jgi:proline dehydrogenase
MSLAGSLAARAGRRYSAGPELSDALAVARRVADKGAGVTLCYWDRGGEDPAEVADAYVAAAEAVAADGLEARVAIKAPALDFDRALLERAAAAARAAGAPLHFDSLAPDTADPTLELAGTLDQARGITLPGRWERSVGDAGGAESMGAGVRVVKGQWPGDPDVDLRGGFLSVIDSLAGRVPYVAVATHDAALVRQALERLRESGSATELELLFGLPPDRAAAEAHRAGVPIRIYIPYGHGWLPYATRQALKHPMTLVWFARDLFSPPAIERLVEAL